MIAKLAANHARVLTILTFMLVAGLLAPVASADRSFHTRRQSPFDEASTGAWPDCVQTPCNVYATADASTGALEVHAYSNHSRFTSAMAQITETVELPTPMATFNATATFQIETNGWMRPENGSARMYLTAHFWLSSDICQCTTQREIIFILLEWSDICDGECGEETVSTPLQEFSIEQGITQMNYQPIPAGPLKMHFLISAHTDGLTYVGQSGTRPDMLLHANAELESIRVVAQPEAGQTRKSAPPGQLRENQTIEIGAPYDWADLSQSCCRESTVDAGTGAVQLEAATEVPQSSIPPDERYAAATLGAFASVPIQADSITVTGHMRIDRADALVQDGPGTPGYARATISLFSYFGGCEFSCETDWEPSLTVAEQCSACAAVSNTGLFAISQTFRRTTDAPLQPGPLDVFGAFGARARGSEQDVPFTTIAVQTGDAQVFLEGALERIIIEIDPAGGPGE